MCAPGVQASVLQMAATRAWRQLGAGAACRRACAARRSRPPPSPSPCPLSHRLPAPIPPPPHLRLQLSVKTGIPEGTSGQICNEIALNPVFQPQLDTAIVSGKKTLQR